MNDRNAHSQPSASQTDAQPASDAALKAASRRRFIKLGASTVPVTLTLSSRPVMAWHCNTTSAWGSHKLAPTAASVKARLEAAQVDGSETWSKSNWQSNSVYSTVSSSKPWDLLADHFGYVKTSSKSKSQVCQEQCTISQLFGSTGLYGIGGTVKVWNAVNNGNGEFAMFMCIARLNMLLTPGVYKTRLNSCFKDVHGTDQILRMAALGPDRYFPSGLPANSPAWNWTKMKLYLESNWMVV